MGCDVDPWMGCDVEPWMEWDVAPWMKRAVFHSPSQPSFRPSVPLVMVWMMQILYLKPQMLLF
jgi:hypothetical protein